MADITYLPTVAGFLFLAVVLDTLSRRLVGWAMQTRLKADLVLQALEMALHQRRPTSVIHQSDQGTRYTSIAFGLRCKAAGVRPSMGSVGNCFDNAMCESFFATLECELLERESFRTQTEAKMKVFDFDRGVAQSSSAALRLWATNRRCSSRALTCRLPREREGRVFHTLLRGAAPGGALLAARGKLSA